MIKKSTQIWNEWRTFFIGNIATKYKEVWLLTICESDGIPNKIWVYIAWVVNVRNEGDTKTVKCGC